MDSSCRTITLTVFTQLFTVLCFVKGIPRFTREPPSVIYVSSGGTARLVWDYDVENRTELFDPYSPEWYLYNTSGSKVRIAVEDGFNKWKFVIHKDCPTRLRGRVSKESTATLVISNVTTADIGVYGCDLVLLSGSPIRSRVDLIITDHPHFNDTLNSSTQVIEGSPLLVLCSASADPVPNVTWVRIMEKCPRFIIAGVGRAFLRFTNITRHQSGTYECQATNNPNDEDPVTMRTEISVKFTVEPANVSVSYINATSALIKWLSPLDEGGSPIVEYKIQISTLSSSETVITHRTYLFFQDLKRNTTYSVKVYARNAAGYGKAVCAGFKTEVQKMQAVQLMVTRKGDPRVRMFAGVFGVIIWIGIMCIVIIFLFVKKRCTGRGKEQGNISSKPTDKRFIKDINNKSTHSVKYKQDIPSQDVSQGKDQPLDDLPIYAQVDKSKKRRPGEIVYVELEQLNTNKDASIINETYIPPRYPETQYADIKH